MGKDNIPRQEPVIRYGAIQELRIYEISEAELAQLEEGSPSALNLNIALFLLGSAISFLVNFLSNEPTGKTYTWFVVIMVVFGLTAIVLLLIWWKQRSLGNKLVERIKSRIFPEGVQVQPAAPASE
jgi:hypothetical protein